MSSPSPIQSIQLSSALPDDDKLDFAADDAAYEFEHHIHDLFDDLRKNFKDKEYKPLFTNYLRDHLSVLSKLEDISNAIKDAKASAPFADFTQEADIEELLASRIYGQYTDMWEVQRKCTSIVVRIIRDGRYGTKMRALEALYSMADRLAGLKDAEGRNILDMVDLGCTFVVRGVNRMGERLDDNDIETLRQNTEFLERLRVVRRAYTKDGLQPFRNLDAFFLLFEDCSIPINFSTCLVDIEAALAREPLSQDALKLPDFVFGGETAHPLTTMPDYVFDACVKHKIATKVNDKSCYETRANALRVLAKIGLHMLDALDGPHKETLRRKWYFLEKDWVDLIVKMCQTKAVIFRLEPDPRNDSEFHADLTLLVERKGYRRPETTKILTCLRDGKYYYQFGTSDNNVEGSGSGDDTGEYDEDESDEDDSDD